MNGCSFLFFALNFKNERCFPSVIIPKIIGVNNHVIKISDLKTSNNRHVISLIF